MAKRLTVAVLFAIFVALPVAFYVNRKAKTPKWQVVGCSVVKDDRIREGESVRLKLSGPTFIELEVLANECLIPLGTEFTDYRVGGNICANAELSKRLPSSVGDCFRIMSETKR